MNERIQELMDQAGELAWEEHKAKCLKNGLDPSMPFGNNLMAIFEKFAELIVEECSYVMDCNKGSDQHTEWNRALSETSNKILEHFGVEE